MTGRSSPSLAGRLKGAYENLPLPLPVVAGLAVDALLARLHPLPLPGSRSLHRTAGLGLLLAGVGLNLWALAERRRHSAGPFELEQPEELVTSGPYAVTRHPMYVGWWLIQLGAGTAAGSAWVLATLPAEVLAEHPGVLREEAKLAERFGRTYPDYAEEVPRYLGIPVRYDRPRLRGGQLAAPPIAGAHGSVMSGLITRLAQSAPSRSSSAESAARPRPSSRPRAGPHNVRWSWLRQHLNHRR